MTSSSPSSVSVLQAVAAPLEMKKGTELQGRYVVSEQLTPGVTIGNTLKPSVAAAASLHKFFEIKILNKGIPVTR